MLVNERQKGKQKKSRRNAVFGLGGETKVEVQGDSIGERETILEKREWFEGLNM